ncbi:hypothetical protein HYV57_05610 [Candidatus Peregrinibacteria bacterium]|nr:hypothetical protein [Candidatus Peregrinibacteria bacterium]
MKNIIVPKPKSDSLIHQLEVFYKTFKNIAADENVIFDLSEINWIHPLIILPIASHIYATNSDYQTRSNNVINRYLSIIHFPKGVNTFESCQKLKSFIPITLIKENNPIERDKIIDCFLNLIYRTTNNIPKVNKSAIFYPITELVTNIAEHSKKDYGFIFGQIYSKKKHLDICILDKGRGLVQSYKQEKNINLTDKEAIEKALSGDSTKSLDRGYGIRTSKKTVCEGFNGDFSIISGEECFIANKTKNQIFTLPGFYWQGVIMAYRIPCPERAVDIYQYLE